MHRMCLLINIIFLFLMGISAYGISKPHLEGFFPGIQFYSPSEYLEHAQNWDVTANSEGALFFANINGILRYDGYDWDIFGTPLSPMGIHYAQNDTLYIALNGDLGIFNRLPNNSYEFQSLSDLYDVELPFFVDTYSITDVNGEIYFLTDNFVLQLKEGGSTYIHTGYTPFLIIDHSTILLLQNRDSSLFYPSNPEIDIILETASPLRLINGLFRYSPNEYIAFGSGGTTYLITVSETLIRVSDYYDSRFDYLKDVKVFNFEPGQDTNFIISTMADGIFQTDLKGNMIHHFDENSGLRSGFALSTWQDKFNNIWMTGYYGITKIKAGNGAFILDERSGLRGETWDAHYFGNKLYVSTNRGLFKAEQTSAGITPFISLDGFEKFQSVGEFRVVFNPVYQEKMLFFQTQNQLFIVDNEEITLFNENILRNPLYLEGFPNYLFATDGFSELYMFTHQNNRWIEVATAQDVFSDFVVDIKAIGDSLALVSYFTNGVELLKFTHDEQENSVTLSNSNTPLFISTQPVVESGEEGLISQIIVKKINNHILLLNGEGILELNPISFELSNSDLIAEQEWTYIDLSYDGLDNIWFLRTNEPAFTLAGFFNKQKSASNSIAIGSPIIASASQLRPYFKEGSALLLTPERIHLLKSDIPHNSLKNQFRLFLQRATLQDGFGLDFLTYSFEDSQLVLDYSKNSISFRAGTNFSTSQNVQYQFFLEGAEDDFSIPSKSPFKEYINLREGNYTLHVRASNALGQVVTQPLLTFTILPPFHRSLAAYLIYLLIFITLMYGALKYRWKKLYQQTDLLKRTVEARTKKLTEQTSKLQHANEIKLQLLRMTAHDLRSPLSAITGYADLIKIEDDPEVMKEYSSVIHDISLKMTDIIQAMMASSAKNIDDMDLKTAPVEVISLLNESKNQFLPHLKSKNQSLVINASQNTYWIEGDVVRIKEVFDNVISNAIKYSPYESAITVGVYSQIDVNTIIIQISDEGPGFAEEDFSELFKEQSKLSAKPTGNEKSTGYGLFIAKKLVNAHGGEITIRNNGSGVGATVIIILPESRFSENMEKEI